MKQLTKSQAVKFWDSGAWKHLNHEEVALFQIKQDKLCLPFEVFHEAIEKVLNTPIAVHALAESRKSIEKEIENAVSKKTKDKIESLVLLPKKLKMG